VKPIGASVRFDRSDLMAHASLLRVARSEEDCLLIVRKFRKNRA
jgi:hypothetical protein